MNDAIEQTVITSAVLIIECERELTNQIAWTTGMEMCLQDVNIF